MTEKALADALRKQRIRHLENNKYNLADTLFIFVYNYIFRSRYLINIQFAFILFLNGWLSNQAFFKITCMDNQLGPT